MSQSHDLLKIIHREQKGYFNLVTCIEEEIVSQVFNLIMGP